MTRYDSRAVALTLRTGVLVSAFFLLAGIILGIGRGGVHPLDASDLSAVPAKIAAFDAEAMIHLGLLILMLTPIARVIAVLIEFARRREVAFVLVSIGVLLLLVMTTAFGFSEGRG